MWKRSILIQNQTVLSLTPSDVIAIYIWFLLYQTSLWIKLNCDDVSRAPFHSPPPAAKTSDVTSDVIAINFDFCRIFNGFLFWQAGDRSLANVVAHEIAHSWTGNLITNRNFEHFWLNEGFTMFIERKIVGRLESPESQDFNAYTHVSELNETVSAFFFRLSRFESSLKFGRKRLQGSSGSNPARTDKPVVWPVISANQILTS